MLVACRKRRISVDILRPSVEKIERDLFQEFEDEITSQQIGEKVMIELFKIDSVAYVRFASVYREFETVDDFKRVVESITDGPTGVGRSALGVGGDQR